MASSSWQLDHISEPSWNPKTVTSTHLIVSSDPPPNPSPPDVRYNLEYVYGYRCADSRQNVFFNQSGQAVYMTAALGIILDQSSNT